MGLLSRGSKRKYYASEAESVDSAVEALCSSIRHWNPDGSPRTIVVTSSVPGEGKTTVCGLLARRLAQGGSSVLAMECDLRRPRLGSELKIGWTGSGLCAVLLGEAELEDAVVPAGAPNLWFLDGGERLPYPSDVFASRSFARALSWASTHFDFTIIDTPPLGAVVDAAVIAPQTDATLFVVREGAPGRADLLRAREQLDRSGARVLGIVYNGFERQ